MATLNAGDSPLRVPAHLLDLHQLGLTGTASARDVWAGKNLGHLDESFRPLLAKHVLLLRLTR